MQVFGVEPLKHVLLLSIYIRILVSKHEAVLELQHSVQYVNHIPPIPGKNFYRK